MKFNNHIPEYKLTIKIYFLTRYLEDNTNTSRSRADEKNVIHRGSGTEKERERRI